MVDRYKMRKTLRSDLPSFKTREAEMIVKLPVGVIETLIGQIWLDQPTRDMLRKELRPGSPKHLDCSMQEIGTRSVLSDD